MDPSGSVELSSVQKQTTQQFSVTTMVSHSRSNQESISSMTSDQTSILVIGASSRTGIECIHQLAEHLSKPVIHAFCDDVSELGEDVAKLCHTVTAGSVRHAVDVEEALEDTGANWVVLCGDASDDDPLNRRQKNLRTVSAKNIVRVLTMPGYESVRVLVVSRIGAAKASNLKLSLRAKLCQLKQSQFLSDNAGQEQELKSIWDRTTVVRTTILTDNITGSGRIVELSDHDKLPSLTTQRSELASCSKCPRHVRPQCQ